jgi:hypothetical protein
MRGIRQASHTAPQATAPCQHARVIAVAQESDPVPM